MSFLADVISTMTVPLNISFVQMTKMKILASLHQKFSMIEMEAGREEKKEGRKGRERRGREGGRK